MFENLTARLSESFKALAGAKRLTEDNLREALEQVRLALLEADVALLVVKDFISGIQEQVLGEEIPAHLTPDKAFIKIVQNKLTELLGSEQQALQLQVRPPAVLLMAGLTGTGKTTTVGKICHFLMQEKKRRIMVASADVHRPGAIEQLEIISKEAGVSFFPTDPTAGAPAIATAALEAARSAFQDVLVIDTAGRTTVDDAMMDELKAIHSAVDPVEVLFVIDAMSGQDAATTAAAFNAALPLTGMVLTKADGDSRGGAALSARMITGCPIKFMGTGEKLDALEVFHPDRIASRILGMGDVLSLIESAEAKVDQQNAARLARKIKRGQKFDLFDFREQLNQVDSMGGMEAMIEKLPIGGPQAVQMAQQRAQNLDTKRMMVILNSMTNQERHRPEIINGSRKKRIARGSGTQIQDINRLLKQHKQMQKMNKKMKSGAGMKKMFAKLQSAAGQSGVMPPQMRRR